MNENKKFLKYLFLSVKKWAKVLRNNNTTYKPSYRIVKIEETADGAHVVIIQLIGKSLLLKEKPEKILIDDKFVNSFSPVDVRTLTYLGYLGINGPKYKILAKHLSEKSDQTLFAVQKKGDKSYKISTANEISNNDELIQGLSQKEAHMVGLTTASEQRETDEKQKESLLRSLKKH